MRYEGGPTNIWSHLIDSITIAWEICYIFPATVKLQPNRTRSSRVETRFSADFRKIEMEQMNRWFDFCFWKNNRDSDSSPSMTIVKNCLSAIRGSFQIWPRATSFYLHIWKNHSSDRNFNWMRKLGGHEGLLSRHPKSVHFRRVKEIWASLAEEYRAKIIIFQNFRFSFIG